MKVKIDFKYIFIFSRLIQQRSSEASKFFYRQFYSCVKVFSNVLFWQEILSESVLKELSLDCLLNRYILIALQNMDSNIQTIEIIEYVSYVFIIFKLHLGQLSWLKNFLKNG